MPVGGLLPLREANRVTFGPKTRTVISRMNEGDMDVRPGAGRTKPRPGPWDGNPVCRSGGGRRVVDCR